MSSKKVLGIGLSVFMGLSMIGCSDKTNTETITSEVESEQVTENTEDKENKSKTNEVEDYMNESYGGGFDKKGYDYNFKFDGDLYLTVIAPDDDELKIIQDNFGEKTMYYKVATMKMELSSLGYENAKVYYELQNKEGDVLMSLEK